MKITVLGSGGEKSTPVYGCKCDACRFANIDSTRRRKPASILLECQGVKLLIDAGIKDFYDRFPAGTLNYILLTQYKIENLLALYDIRSGVDVSIRVIGPHDPKGCADLQQSSGILNFEQKAFPLESFFLNPFSITPLSLEKSNAALGYLVSCNGKCLAYFPDRVALDESLVSNLREARVDVIFIDSYSSCLGVYSGSACTDMARVVSVHNGILTKKTIITHLGHDMDNWLIQHGNTLPFDIEPAYEGQILLI